MPSWLGFDLFSLDYIDYREFQEGISSSSSKALGLASEEEKGDGRLKGLLLVGFLPTANWVAEADHGQPDRNRNPYKRERSFSLLTSLYVLFLFKTIQGADVLFSFSRFKCLLNLFIHFPVVLVLDEKAACNYAGGGDISRWRGSALTIRYSIHSFLFCNHKLHDRMLAIENRQGIGTQQQKKVMVHEK